MTKYYKSDFYNSNIKVENINWEILVIIKDKHKKDIIYSWYDIKEKKTESIYINKCILWWIIKKIPKNVLIIGFWWWAFAKYFEDNLNLDIDITWIEIDKTMIDIAKNELKVKTNNFYIEDAKTAIEKINKKNIKYDLILIDVYWKDAEIPNYFIEKDFFENVKNILRKSWVLSINYSDYDIINKQKNNKYKKIHNNIINVFWKYYNHILSWENNRWNISWIYNLDKFYTAKDFDDNYMNLYKKWEVYFNENIIKNTFVE